MTAPRDARFPGFDVLSQRDHWDATTSAAITSRLRNPEPPRFFTLPEEAAADALFDRLLGMTPQTRIPVTALVDARLAEERTDGWRYADMPEDGTAWKLSLKLLDRDAEARFGRRLCECEPQQQDELIGSIHDLGSEHWHEFVASRIWSLWTRYACTAFYSHPQAWNEIGFPGPAFPRGYAALGIDKREPYEVADSRPHDAPIPPGQL